MWKNSSWILSFPAINWISSINRTSIFLYLFLNCSFLLSFIALINWLVNFSEVTYNTFEFGLFFITWCPIACIKCVFPNPTSPYKNNGLYEVPGASATAKEAACANLLLFPTTNVSNVYLWFKELFETPISLSLKLFSSNLTSSSSESGSLYSTMILQSLFVINLNVFVTKS